MTALNTYKARHVLESELRIQYCMQAISEAVDWGQIREAMEEFFELLRDGTFEAKSDESLSPLVRNAVQMVRKYYDHGLTLEETADVSLCRKSISVLSLRKKPDADLKRR